MWDSYLRDFQREVAKRKKGIFLVPHSCSLYLLVHHRGSLSCDDDNIQVVEAVVTRCERCHRLVKTRFLASLQRSKA
jgi:hypothetical protein